jgi:hypothetical protein
MSVNTVRLSRPAKHRASDYPGWEDTLGEVVTGYTLEVRLAQIIMELRSCDTTRILHGYHHLSAIERRMLAGPAATLGIAADDPLLPSRVAMELATREKAWSVLAGKGGRPRNPDRSATAAAMLEFVKDIRHRRGQLPKSAIVRSPAFRRRFPDVSKRTALRLLSEAQRANLANQK